MTMKMAMPMQGDDNDDNGQSVIVRGSLVDKQNETQSVK